MNRVVRLVVAVSAIISLSQTAFAHEGHDHAPGVINAPHGGVLEETDRFAVELVTVKEGLKLYLFDHEMNSVDLKGVQVEGKMTLPRNKKSEAVSFKLAKDHFEAKVKAKGAYRYVLDLSVTKSGKTDKVRFNVEPK